MYPLSRLFLFCTVLAPLTLCAQTCQSDFPATTPTERFEINNDTVYDTQTGLSWKRCLQGLSGIQCEQGAILYLNWEQALQAADAETGWRLPNIRELKSIVEKQCAVPALNIQVFPGDNASNVWSSSPFAYNTTSAWYVTFATGESFNYTRDHALQVRLVRSGQ